MNHRRPRTPAQPEANHTVRSHSPYSHSQSGQAAESLRAFSATCTEPMPQVGQAVLRGDTVESVGKWRTKDRVVDAPATVDRIARELGEQRSWVEDVLRDLRFVLDRFVADDFIVYAPPFLVRRRGDPVWVALRDLPDADWDKIERFDDEHLAPILGLDEELVRRHPVVAAADVLYDLRLLRGVDMEAFDAERPAALTLAKRLTDLVDAWLDMWDPEVNDYRTSGVGLESAFQAWLVADLGRLATFGLPLELLEQEHRFADGTRADVLCRATSETSLVRRGDLVVIENKAHMVHVEACEQLRGYVERARAELAAPGQQVHGVLIADGRTLELQQCLYDEGFSYVSLSALGYRDWLHGSPEVITEAEGPDPVRAATMDTGPVPSALSARTALMTAGASSKAQAGPWLVAGAKYSKRSAANRALSAHLGGVYTPAQWQEAQRQYGLR
jgi:hypothetical protein